MEARSHAQILTQSFRWRDTSNAAGWSLDGIILDLLLAPGVNACALPIDAWQAGRELRLVGIHSVRTQGRQAAQERTSASMKVMLTTACWRDENVRRPACREAAPLPLATAFRGRHPTPAFSAVLSMSSTSPCAQANPETLRKRPARRDKARFSSTAGYVDLHSRYAPSGEAGVTTRRR